MAMLQIFGKGAGKFAGYAPTSHALKAGLDAVFKWWCQKGILLGGEPDLKDVAAEVAIETALAFGAEEDDINSILPSMIKGWKAASCGGRTGFSRATSRSRQSSRSHRR